MLHSRIVHVDAPVEFDLSEEGVIVTLCSGAERFQFHLSRHRGRAANYEMRKLLDAADRACCQVYKMQRGRG